MKKSRENRDKFTDVQFTFSAGLLEGSNSAPKFQRELETSVSDN